MVLPSVSRRSDMGCSSVKSSGQNKIEPPDFRQFIAGDRAPDMGPKCSLTLSAVTCSLSSS